MLHRRTLLVLKHGLYDARVSVTPDPTGQTARFFLVGTRPIMTFHGRVLTSRSERRRIRKLRGFSSSRRASTASTWERIGREVERDKPADTRKSATTCRCNPPSTPPVIDQGLSN